MEPVVAGSCQPIASSSSAFADASGMDGEAVPAVAVVIVCLHLAKPAERGWRPEGKTHLAHTKGSEISGHCELRGAPG